MQSQSPTLEQRLIAICQTVRNEALDPALKEAEHVRLAAEREKGELLRHAREEAKEIVEAAEKKAQEIQKTLEMSLIQASRQAVEILKERVEHALFNPALTSYISRGMESPEETADLIKALLASIESEGVFGETSVAVGQMLSKDKIVAALGKEVIEKLKSQSVQIGNHSWGAIITIEDKHIVLDVSDRAVKEIMAGFLRQEFRKFLFVDEF